MMAPTRRHELNKHVNVPKDNIIEHTYRQDRAKVIIMTTGVRQ